MLEPLIATAVMLAAGVAGALCARAARVSPIVGYLAAGVVLGPHVLDAAPHGPLLHLLGELGVGFLLFDVGLHFSLKDLWRTRRQLALGPLQVLLGGALIAALAWVAGIRGAAALYVGVALALSSTAVAIQSLRERGESHQPLGRSATAILVFQDLVAVVLISLIGAPDAAHPGDAPISGASAAVVAVAGLAAVALFGRALRPLLGAVSRASEEAFTATALLLVLVTGGLTAAAGLSLPLGAFLGGMLLSESEYCYMVKTELRPFRGLLLGLFFLTVGIGLDLAAIGAELGAVAAAAVALTLAKVAGTAAAARLGGQCRGFSLRLGFTLAQGSEFALVVMPLLAVAQLLSPGDATLLASAVALSMAASPLLSALGDRVAERVERGRTDPGLAAAARVPGRVVIDGAGARALEVAAALDEHDVDYVLLSADAAALARARAEGFHVAFGNADALPLLESAGEQRLRALVLDRAEPALIRALRQRHPGLEVLVCADSEARSELESAGARVCEPEAGAPALALAEAALALAGVPEEARRRYRARFEATPWERADKLHAA